MNELVSLKAFLIHAATDPKLQQLLASLGGEQLTAYLVSSGLSESDAALYAAARESHEGKQAFADALNRQQHDGWVLAADGWIMSPEGWIMAADGWIMAAGDGPADNAPTEDGWIMSSEA